MVRHVRSQDLLKDSVSQLLKILASPRCRMEDRTQTGVRDGTIVHYKCGSYLPLTENWIYAQINNLRRYRPIVYCHETENLSEFRIQEVRCLKDKTRVGFYTNKLARKFIGFYPSFACHLALDKPRLIHAHFGFSGYHFLRSKRLFGLPMITTFYGNDISGIFSVYPDFRQRYQELFRNGDLFLVEGSHMRECLLNLGCQPEKALVQHIGIDTDNIAYRPRYLDDSGDIRVLVAARFREKKGIPDAIEAFGRARRDNSKLRLTILGDSTGTPEDEREKERILRTIRVNNLTESVTLPGFKSCGSFTEELYRHHIYLAPSLSASDGDTEGGAPVSILEASASGMPVLSTLHCDIPETVLDGQSGYLVPERDVAALAERLGYLASDPSTWPKLGEVGRAHIEEGYKLTRQVEKLESIYDMVLAR